MPGFTPWRAKRCSVKSERFQDGSAQYVSAETAQYGPKTSVGYRAKAAADKSTSAVALAFVPKSLGLVAEGELLDFS